MKMIHPLACAALSAVLLAAVPATAQTAATPAPATTPGAPVAAPAMKCTEAEMKTMSDNMMKMADPAKKAAAMKEMDMAKGMMAKNDEKGCMMQMDKAMGMMK